MLQRQRQLMLKQWQDLQKQRNSDNLLAASTSLMPRGASAAVSGFPTASLSTTSSPVNNYNQYFHFQESNHLANKTTLDPLERNILFNIEGPNNNKLECSDYLSSFPSIESGSLSALMHTAVGESSSDHDQVQEEWGGLSFQNTKHSMENRHPDWVGNNDVSSLNGKSRAPSGATNMSPSFPGFQLSHSSHESTQQGSQLNHMMQPPLRNDFPFQSFADQNNIFAKSHDEMSVSPSFGSSFEPRVQQGNHNNATSSTGSVSMKNQHQMYSSVELKNQSPQATLPRAANKLPPFDLFIPRSASQSNSSFDLVGQQFPILEAALVESSKIPTSPFENKLSLQELPSNSQSSPNPRAISQVLGQSAEQTWTHHQLESSPVESSKRPTSPWENKLSSLQELPSSSQSSPNPRAISEVVSQSAEQTWTRHHQLESVAKNLSEENRASSNTQACDFKAFGHSLKPSKQMNPVSGSSSSMFSNPYAYRDTYKQYPRNGQMLSMTEKSSIHESSSGKQIENLEMINQDNQNVDLSMTKFRKRKKTDSDLVPWHVEVAQSSKRLQSISKAETEWVKASNRIFYKVDNEINVVQTKKRLALTTQLTQQIFSPPPAATLHSKATQVYENLAYFSAKLALGDACNLSYCSKNVDLVIEESNASDKVSTIVKDFTCRAENMEKDFVRLDKSTSFLDVIIESKEMEKIAIINRFARFHIRRQQNELALNMPRPAPEKYVKALRGRPIPENAQCLQL